MSLVKYTLTAGEWKKISGAGENGTAWLKRHDGSRSVIMISHTDATLSPTDDIEYADALPDLDIDIAYELPMENEGISEPLSADNASDIYYATIRDVGETCEIITDFA